LFITQSYGISNNMTTRKTKALGQHFLKNPYVLRKIIDCISPQNQDLIIEIGAGKGALTFPLTERAGKVVAIERDKELASFIRNKNIPNLLVLEENVLYVNFREIVSKENPSRGRVKIVGNLPYSISSPILFTIYEHKDLFSECVFLLQKEVAERICSLPGSKKFAPITILFQNVFETQICAQVGPGSFTPPPKVRSTLISLKKREKTLYPLHDEQEFFRFLKTSFQSRRKTLFNNLILSGHDRVLLDDVFQSLELEKMIRPEQLSISRFRSLFETLRATSPPID
jgi:16S rRNA (adenine1518-N6/adenine1519-N6)-dimethyltransferase